MQLIETSSQLSRSETSYDSATTGNQQLLGNGASSQVPIDNASAKGTRIDPLPFGKVAILNRRIPEDALLDYKEVRRRETGFPLLQTAIMNGVFQGVLGIPEVRHPTPGEVRFVLLDREHHSDDKANGLRPQLLYRRPIEGSSYRDQIKFVSIPSLQQYV